MSIKFVRLRYNFDSNGSVSKIFDDTDQILRSYTYVPGTSRVDTITSAGGQSVKFTWGPSGHVESVKDQAGNSWDYNAARQPTSISYPDGSVTCYPMERKAASDQGGTAADSTVVDTAKVFQNRRTLRCHCNEGGNT